MEEQLIRRIPMQQSHAQDLRNKTRVDPLTHGPAHDLTAVKIENGGQVKPAFPCLNVGDVRHPDLIGRGGQGCFSQAIMSNGLVVSAHDIL